MPNEIRALRNARRSAPLILLVAQLVSCASAQGESFVVTNPPSIRKVLPASGDARPKADTLRIAMARGEYEPVQIVVHAGDNPLRAVRVSVSDLAGPAGSSVPDARIAVTPIGYVTCKRPSNTWTPLLKDKGGEVPDVLLPDRPVDVPGGRRQPYYLTVHALPADPPGEYRGRVSVSAEGRETREIPLVVRIYDVVLPLKPHLRTAFGLDTGYRKIKGADAGQDLDTLLQYSKLLLEHRVSPCVYGNGAERTGVPARWPEDNTSWDFSGMDRYLSELVPLGLTSFYTCGHLSSPYFADHLKSRGWFDLAYVYMFDEAPMTELPRMRENCEGLQKVVPGPGVRILQVSWSPVRPLEGLVNMWCPLLSRADTRALQNAREKGEEVWWYVCNVPVEPYPNFCWVDYPGIYARITGWMTYHCGIQGFLYFAVDIWDQHPVTRVEFSVGA